MLIDVSKECIVMGTTACEYYALSYVWGGAIPTTTTVQNLAALQRAGSLRNAVFLPRTVADAISLTGKMGARYLWVDCLCIIQNSPEKHRDIANMDVIFSQAELTIVAASSSDANSGISGIEKGTRRRRVLSRVQGSYIQSLRLPTDKYYLLSGGTYATRGWTFQEVLLS